MVFKDIRYLLNKIAQVKQETKKEVANEFQIKKIDGISLQGFGNIPLKTINGNSIIGSGDISVSGGTFSGTLDDISDGTTYKRVTQTEKNNWNNKVDATHNHNNIYYTESEVDTLLANKSDITHNHNLANLSEKSYNSLTDKPDLSSLHTHSNKTLLDSLTSSGDGTQFLANDGTYKTPSGGSGSSGQLVVSIYSNASANLTLTNQANAEQFLGNSNRNIIKLDLTNYTQVRLTARVVTASASANSPRLYVEYSTTFSTSLASYVNIGTANVAISLSTATLADSGWIDLVSGAKADVFIAILQNGGDGAADPALGQIQLHFR